MRSLAGYIKGFQTINTGKSSLARLSIQPTQYTRPFTLPPQSTHSSAGRDNANPRPETLLSPLPITVMQARSPPSHHFSRSRPKLQNPAPCFHTDGDPSPKKCADWAQCASSLPVVLSPAPLRNEGGPPLVNSQVALQSWRSVSWGKRPQTCSTATPLDRGRADSVVMKAVARDQAHQTAGA